MPGPPCGKTFRWNPAETKSFRFRTEERRRWNWQLMRSSAMTRNGACATSVKAENVYETKEAAFEAAVAAASLALRQGHEVAFPLPDWDLPAGLARIKQRAYHRQGWPDARI